MKGRKGTKVKNKKVIVLSVLGLMVAFIAAGVFGVVTLCNSWLEDLPDYQNADAYNTAQPTMVYASDGTTLLAEFQLENRDPVALDQISEYVLKGTVATEDERFYTHSGVDYLGVARALVNNLMGGELEGASTITQQFVRNTILSDEMRDISFKRKIREMYISQKLEEQYSKDEILLMYLNTINYGSGAYGIEAAAERYFSKDAKDLTLNEAATLVGIPQSPTYNNPIDYPDNCLKRRNTVLDRMVSNGVITAEEADAVKAEPIELNPSEPSMTGILAYPYFTSYVRNQLTNPEGKYAYSISELFKGGVEGDHDAGYRGPDRRRRGCGRKGRGGRRSLRGGHGRCEPRERLHRRAGGRSRLRELSGEHGHGRGRRGPSGRIVVQAVHAFGGYQRGHRPGNAHRCRLQG